MANSARRRRATDIFAGCGANMTSQELEAIESMRGSKSRIVQHPTCTGSQEFMIP